MSELDMAEQGITWHDVAVNGKASSIEVCDDATSNVSITWYRWRCANCAEHYCLTSMCRSREQRAVAIARHIRELSGQHAYYQPAREPISLFTSAPSREWWLVSQDGGVKKISGPPTPAHEVAHEVGCEGEHMPGETPCRVPPVGPAAAKVADPWHLEGCHGQHEPHQLCTWGQARPATPAPLAAHHEALARELAADLLLRSEAGAALYWALYRHADIAKLFDDNMFRDAYMAAQRIWARPKGGH